MNLNNQFALVGTELPQNVLKPASIMEEHIRKENTIEILFKKQNVAARIYTRERPQEVVLTTARAQGLGQEFP